MIDREKFRAIVRQEKRERVALEDMEAKKGIGKRLTMETVRLNLTSTRSAELASCSRRTWGHYESGATTPDAATLRRLDQLGFDILYVITGRRGRKRATPFPAGRDRINAR